jgi:predicted HNH restriction endonuclease
MFRLAPPLELKKLEAIFRHKIFKMLLAKGKVSREMIAMLSTWRHSGFHVFCGNRISPRDETAMENMARYIIRASFSQERMTYSSQRNWMLPRNISKVQKTVTINAFERNAKARRACIKRRGLNCVVCGFSFEAAYGRLGKDFIHLHHIIPVGTLHEEYEVDPTNDLVPVCPNCHAMIQRVTPPLSIGQLKNILKG